MKRSFFLCLFLLTSCFHKDNPTNSKTGPEVSEQIKVKPEEKPKDHELLRLSRYLEQADAVHREAWWVVAAERKPQGQVSSANFSGLYKVRWALSLRKNPLPFDR